MSGETPSHRLDNLSIAVAHWHVDAWGGAEYVASELAKAVDADEVYTMGNPSPESENPFADVPFVDLTSSLSMSKVRRLQNKAGRVFEYGQWEDVDWKSLGEFDVLITSGVTTRSVITPDDMLHINYCHSPPRWFYDLYHDRKSSLKGRLARPLLRYLRLRDIMIDPRVDYYLVNSPVIERRLWKYYKRESEILYPPIDLSNYYDDGSGKYYLHLGRLDKEKGIGAILTAFEELDKTLVMAGGMGNIDSSTADKIERVENIDYRGFVTEDEKYRLLAQCRAVVFNGWNEDFGIVPIEASASGKACLTRDEGFPGLFIKDAKNGYKHDGTPNDIRKAIRKFETNGIDSNLREFVVKFSRRNFATSLADYVTDYYNEFINRA